MILTGDIGGTKTNLAFFEVQERGLMPVVEETCASREHSSLDDTVRRFVSAHALSIDSACFGVAGPVKHGRCGAAGQSATAVDVLRRGAEQVAAGYVMYGRSTVFVYTCGTGVNGFTWDDERGELVLTHPAIRCPQQGHYYSANLGHYHEWHPHIQRCIDYLTEYDPLTHRPYSLRYTGALVADVHRSLLEGGLYFYPADAAHQQGKLRLLYECAPLAFVVEQAGGCAESVKKRGD